MKITKFTIQVVITGILLNLCCKCAPASADHKKPKLGTKVTAATVNGANVTVSDTRKILPSGGLAGEETTLYDVQATIETIDKAARTLILKLPDGATRTVVVPEEVKNFAKMNVGDTVKAAYKQKVTFEFREPTADEIAMSGSELTAEGRAPVGGMPGAIAASKKLTIVTVESVSKAKGEIVVKTADNRLVSIHAKYPENLKFAKKGQKAVVTYGEAIAATVESAQ
jgi:hypothetical protein